MFGSGPGLPGVGTRKNYAGVDGTEATGLGAARTGFFLPKTQVATLMPQAFGVFDEVGGDT